MGTVDSVCGMEGASIGGVVPSKVSSKIERESGEDGREGSCEVRGASV